MNNKNQMGSIIRYERNKAGLTLNELCIGLCTYTFLRRIESGEQMCEKILADALLQRAGVSADKFTYMINPDEQSWLIIREEMLDTVEQGDKEKAEPLLEKYRQKTEKESKLHHQLLLLAKVVLSWKNDGNKEIMRELLTDAWHVTMADVPVGEIVCKNLTLTELIITMMYYRIGEDMGNTAEAMDGYNSLLIYLEQSADEEDSVKLYSQISYRQAKLLLKEGRAAEAAAVAKESVALLKVRGRLFYLKPLLEIVYEHGALQTEEKKELQEICSSLEWLYEKYGVDDKKWIWNIPFGMAEVELVGHLIRSRRNALEISQEELADGICSSVSLCRIEKYDEAPRQQIFNQLMKKIGMTGAWYETVTAVDRPELLGIAIEISILLSHSKGAEAEPLIKELEDKQNTKHMSKFAKQYLLHVKALALYNQKKIDAVEHNRMQEEALYLTLPHVNVNKLKEWSFSNREVSIINVLSYSYGKTGKENEIIELLQIVQQQYERKPFNLMHYVVGYELTMRNLGNVLGNVGRYQEAIESAEKGIKLGLQAGRGAVLIASLYDLGWDMEQMKEKERYTKKESLPYVKTSYSLSKVFSQTKFQTFLFNHLKEHYTLY